jgi:uroporphyrin-III C-methyltransferase/precorrin-2 dehydrogenase/sirohydrochlorin ferrochelatase
MKSLPLFHRISGQPVIVLGEGDAAAAKRRLVERAGGIVTAGREEGVEQGAQLAFVAHGDPGLIEADVAYLRGAGVLVNVPDHPDLCDFTVPSILDRDPVLIAIGTSGASAGLAKAIRLRLERILPQRLGLLADALNGARLRLRERWPDAGDRRRMLDRALVQGGPLDPLRENAADAVQAWLEGDVAGESAGWFTINLRSDDPEDLTLRQARLLGSADLIVHDPDVPAAILARARADAVRELWVDGSVEDRGAVGLSLILRSKPDRE